MTDYREQYKFIVFNFKFVGLTDIGLECDFHDCQIECYKSPERVIEHHILLTFNMIFSLFCVYTNISFVVFFPPVFADDFSINITGVWSLNSLPTGYVCEKCGKLYKRKSSLRNHVRDECGQEPGFHCYICPYKTHQKGNLIRHLTVCHKTQVSVNPYVRQVTSSVLNMFEWPYETHHTDSP